MNDRHRRVAKLKAQEEKRLRARDARIIREIISGVTKKVMAVAEGIANVAKIMSK